MDRKNERGILCGIHMKALIVVEREPCQICVARHNRKDLEGHWLLCVKVLDGTTCFETITIDFGLGRHYRPGTAQVVVVVDHHNCSFDSFEGLRVVMPRLLLPFTSTTRNSTDASERELRSVVHLKVVV